MRFWTSFLCVLLLSGLVSAQQKKFLVSPNQEVIPVNQETNHKLTTDFTKGPKYSPMADCNTKPIYGFDTARYPFSSNFGFLHKNIAGEWFVMPADGTVDTVYFYTYANVGPGPEVAGSQDSTVLFRIFTSNITPTSGPGVRPGPYRPPCTSWGYWINTTDDDQGVAGFKEDATPPYGWGDTSIHKWNSDSSWVATNLLFGDYAKSFPPFGKNIWGGQGFPVTKIKSRSVIKVAMGQLFDLNVHKGDVIFISFLVPAVHHITTAQDVRFEIEASGTNAPYPSRDWKFYEHDTGPNNCAGIDFNKIKRGWVPRGAFVDDTLATAAFNIWFQMSPTSNTPPQITSVEQIPYTLSHAPITFSSTMFDCDKEVPARAGITSALYRYRVNGVGTTHPWTTLPMTNTLGDEYIATIPGQDTDFTVVEYKVVAFDATGAADSSGIYSYRIIGLEPPGYYRLDTTTACTPSKSDVITHGTVIDTTKWFIAPRSFAGTSVPHRGDDGTAGPFALSHGFVYYGDTMHYAWIGVNGAIALSKTAADTIDVNSNGFATTGYDFPNSQHHSRLDTLHPGYMPKAFIAPFWADWIAKQDSPLATFGHVRYYDDSTKFVAEWDSLGNFNANGDATADIAVFRAVLLKSNNSVEFQYDDIGIGGLDTANLTGMQCDSNYHPVVTGDPPFDFWNKAGYPVETHVRNGLCVHYIPVTSTVPVADGWNLLSVPATYSINSKTYLYPTAISQAFIYSGGYVPAANLTPGPGFWLKFQGAGTGEAIGRALTHLDINVASGWNMIGSINSPVAVANVTGDPATGINGSSTFFSYGGGYNVATAITPGLGYWVRATGAGQIHLSASGSGKMGSPVNELANLTKVTISDKGKGTQSLYIGTGAFDVNKYEMPPVAPAGSLDARFATNRMVETFPAVLDPSKKYEFPIQINASQYPVSIKWSAPRSTGTEYSLTLKADNGKVIGLLNGSGKVTLSDASVKRVMISVTQGSSLPRVFALGRNYPNPFNPTTQFMVEMPRSGDVDVSVYDLLGRKIATLLSGEQTAGYHTMEWDSHDAQGKVVASGMYFIRMNVPSEQFSATEKVMLLK
jgi:hypothetical protein